MQREVETCGVRLPPYALQQVETLVNQGLERMRRTKAVDHPGLVINAERNLRRLVRYLAEYAREAGSFPELEPRQFDAAMRSCPAFWPYSTSF